MSNEKAASTDANEKVVPKVSLDLVFRCNPPERWRMVKIPDRAEFDGFYKVSNLGRLKTLDRVVTRTNPNGAVISQLRKGKFIESSGRTNLVRLRGSSGEVLGTGLHRLVALAFVKGYAPNSVVRHKDDNTENNFWKNLIWGTQADNIQDRQDRNRQAKGVKTAAAKLTNSDIRKIRKMLVNYPQRFVADKFGVDKSVICRINTGLAWSHV